MSHGSMTSDSVLNTFLEILCHENPTSYLSTFFISMLREHRNWSCLRNWFAPSELATPSRPTQNSTRPILIPCHVNGVHWVGIVRRIIRNKVCFLYADDLNQETTRTTLQELLAATADAEFYPPNSIWINCKSITYRPHSNECGPRVLLALTIMSLHPNPSENMLLPYMHNNIAQICRTWITSSILNGKIILPEWLHGAAALSSSSSIPAYLFSWTSTTTEQTPSQNRGTTPSNKFITKATKGRFSNNNSNKNKIVTRERPTNLKQISNNSMKNNLGNIKPSSQPPVKTRGIQTTLLDAFTNTTPEEPDKGVWGHHPAEINNQDTLRILFSNPRGLQLSTDIMETQFSLGRVHSLHAGVLCLAETNLNWGHPRALTKFHGLIRKIWRHTSVSKSYTKDDFSSERQPGGTITMACNHWTSRVLEKGEDPFGLGRWSYIVLRGKDTRKILVITAYRVCRQTIQSVGVKTSNAQQFRQLSKTFRDADLSGDPIPRHQFIVDLQGWIEHKIGEGHQIILSIDANESFNHTAGSFTPVPYTLEKPIPLKGHDGSIATLVKTCGLCDPLLHHHPDQPPPPTYDRGKDKIDFIFASIELLPSVKRSGIFPYNTIFMSDHRPCYLDIDSALAFSESTPQMAPPQYRGLQLQDPRPVAAYIKDLTKQLDYHKITDKAQNLLNRAIDNNWTESLTDEYEKLDTLITEAMLRAEKNVSKKVSKTYQWSPSLQASISALSYWKLRLSQLHGKAISTHTLNKLYKKTIINPVLQRQLPLEEVIKQVRQARATLKEHQKKHVELRENHLTELAEAIVYARNPALIDLKRQKEFIKRSQKELRRIKRKEALSRMHRRIKYTLHPDIASGGLNRIDIPKSTNLDPYPKGPDPKVWEGAWHTINDPTDLAKHVCAANQRQYHQAINTPFGMEPLASAIGYRADTRLAEDICKGGTLPASIKENLLPETKAIFDTLAQLAVSHHPQLSSIINADQLKSCYKAMSEHTSSSPSGRHLGHYKAAILSDPIASIHSIMMSIPLTAGFSPTRWRHIVDVMLPKKVGDYRIHRLRIVALQESDFNQANRLAIGRPLQRLVESTNLAPDMQHGSRASKRCHSAVLNKQLTFEIHRYAKKPLAYIENDAVGCYDRIINPLVLIFLRILGLHPSTVSSLAKTWEQSYHRIKTAYGISDEIYSNSAETLLFGPGQGSTIGPFLWLLCFILIFLSLTKDTPAIHLSAVDSSRPTKYVGEGFVDDTGLGTNQQTQSESLIENVERLAQQWEKLLYSTGGALNLSKCFWFQMSWSWKGGKAGLDSVRNTPGVLYLTSEGELHTKVKIPRIEPTSSFRTLGVHLSPSGSNKGALAVMTSFILDYCTTIKGSHLSRQDALMSYIQYLLPKLRFQPPVLSLTKHQCDKLISPIYMALLPKLHVNRNTSRTIIFGPERLGGLSLPHIYVVTNIDKLQLFLGHLRVKDRTGDLIHIDLSYLQLLSGSGTFVLNQDPSKCNWIEPGWIHSLWMFTSQHSLTFYYPGQWLPTQARKNDKFLMELFMKLQSNNKDMEILNRCRLFLQVITLSDITNAEGDRIIKEAKKGRPLGSRPSSLLWPNQGSPSQADWKVWSHYISLLEVNGKLHCPLGPWIGPTHQTWHHQYDPLTGLVYDLQGPSLKCYLPTIRQNRILRSGQWYDFSRYQVITEAPGDLIPVTVYHRPVATGAFFQIGSSSNAIPPPTPQAQVGIRPRQYYNHLIPVLQDTPLHEIMLSLTNSDLLVSVKGISTKDRRGTSQWLFESNSIHHEGSSSIQLQCSRYRAELLGILSVLYIIYKGEQLQPVPSPFSILLQCGHNKALKEAFRTSPEGITTATQANSDIIMDIRHLRHLISIRIQPIYAQSQLDPPMPTPTVPTASIHEILRNPSLRYPDEAISYTPLSHVISIFYNNKELTEDLYPTIKDLAYTKPLKEKLQKDNSWSEDDFQSVDWDAFYTAIRRIPRSHRISITKLSHQLWNTNLQNSKYYNQSEKCPICKLATEDFNHLFHCPHPSADNNRREAAQHLIKTIQPCTPPTLLETLEVSLNQWITAGQVPSFGGSRLPAVDILHQAICNQTDIGWSSFCRGHVSRHWRTAFLLHYRPKKPQPESKCSEIADKWLSLLLTSAWTFSEKVWTFRNKVVHGQLEEFRESKIIQNLRGRIKELYFQFREDPFMVPHTRSHLFNKPMEATSSMDKDGLACWIKSVEEAILTREHRDKLEAVHLKSTIYHFFKTRSRCHKSKIRKRYIPKLWDAPFSARYYQRSKTGGLKSRPLRYIPSHSITTKTRLRNKSKRNHAPPHPTRTLLEFGFRQQPVHPLIEQDRKKVEKMDYSGTLVSTAP
jgi:hypothetical protein